MQASSEESADVSSSSAWYFVVSAFHVTCAPPIPSVSRSNAGVKRSSHAVTVGMSVGCSTPSVRR